MRIRNMLAALSGLVALTGCGEKTLSGTDTVLPEAAYIRYVNAVPDTSSLDFRFVDGGIEGSPQYANVPFRSFTAYQRIRPGSRQMKVFTNPNAYANSAAVAVQVHVDTTFTFEPNARYTIISHGFSRTGQTPKARLVIIRDELPATLTATQVGVRTIHGALGVGNVDVYVRPSEVTPTTISGAPTFANLAPLGVTLASPIGVSAYVALTARPVGALSYRWDVAPAGTTTAIPLATFAGFGLPGIVGTAAQNPLAGFQVGRTAVTVLIVGPSVVGSRAPSAAAFTSATAIFMPDKALDSTEP